MAITESAPQTTEAERPGLPVDESVAADGAASTEVVEEVLVEEISIDGMCGVY